MKTIVLVTMALLALSYVSGQVLSDTNEVTAICALANSFSHPAGSAATDWTCQGSTPVTNPCTWLGVLCVVNGTTTYVDSINLFSRQITGTIPPEIGLFHQLHILDLGANGLTGTVPASIGNLVTLTTLAVDSNQLSGSFPAGLSNLTQLVELYISGNSFVGCLPNLENLTKIAAAVSINNTLNYFCTISIAPLPGSNDKTQFTCPSVSNGCPQTAANLNLFRLPGAKCIFDCNCTWTSWSAFSACTRNTTATCVGTSQRTRTVDQYLLGCPNITAGQTNTSACATTCPGPSVDVSTDTCTNAFNGAPCTSGSATGTCSATVCSANRLRASDQLALCALAASITRPSSALPGQWTCTNGVPDQDPCSGIGWSGVSCLSDGNSTWIDIIQLYNQNLQGSIPPAIGLFSNLTVLDLGSNGLNGTIPSSIGNLISLKFLGLDFNYNPNAPQLGSGFTGTLPASIGNLVNLQQLYLENEQFTGCLPDLSKLTQLKPPIVSAGALTIYFCTISLVPLLEDATQPVGTARQFTCPSVSNGCPQSPQQLALFQLPNATCIFDCECTWTTWSGFSLCSRNGSECGGTSTRTRTVDQYLLGCPGLFNHSVEDVPTYKCDLTCPGNSSEANTSLCTNAFNGATCSIGGLPGVCTSSECVAAPPGSPTPTPTSTPTTACPDWSQWTTVNPTCNTSVGFCSELRARYRVDRCTLAVDTDFVLCYAANGTSCLANATTQGACVLGFCVPLLDTCVWSSWTPYGPCLPNYLSCFGVQTRSREPIIGSNLCPPNGTTESQMCLSPNGTTCYLAANSYSPYPTTGLCYLGVCTSQVPNLDCSWNTWSSWGPCKNENSNTPCRGYAYRSRTQNPPLGKGKPCSGPVAQKITCSLPDTTTCYCTENRQPGYCSAGQCVEDCTYGCWSCWSSWSGCAYSCGSRTRTRYVRSTWQDYPKYKRDVEETELVTEVAGGDYYSRGTCSGLSTQVSACQSPGCYGYSVQQEVIIDIYGSFATENTDQTAYSDDASPPNLAGPIAIIVVPSVVALILVIVGVVMVVRYIRGRSNPPASHSLHL